MLSRMPDRATRVSIMVIFICFQSGRNRFIPLFINQPPPCHQRAGLVAWRHSLLVKPGTTAALKIMKLMIRTTAKYLFVILVLKLIGITAAAPGLTP